MVSSNQRSINEGIRKVIGSSNRSFATTDPERQPRIVTQPARPAPTRAPASRWMGRPWRRPVRAGPAG
jgi:hypothetical protein